MMVSLASCMSDFHEDRRGRTEAPARKVLVFSAVVFVIVFVSIAALLPHFGQGTFPSLLAGFFVGSTAIEVGWFGGHASFSKNGDG